MYDDSRPSIVRPRYDIDKVATTKKLKSAKQSMYFAELDLDGKLVRYSVTSQPSQAGAIPSPRVKYSSMWERTSACTASTRV